MFTKRSLLSFFFSFFFSYFDVKIKLTHYHTPYVNICMGYQVADTEHTERNAKCEMLGKHAKFSMIILQALVYFVGIVSLIIYAYYMKTRK
jgi:hypothetical protein